MSTTAPTAADGIELTVAARTAILWEVGASSREIGEEIGSHAGGVAEFERLIERLQMNATVWRAALAGTLTPSAEVRDWLRGLRGRILAVIADDRGALEYERHELDSEEEYQRHRSETESLLADDLARLAACEDLLAKAGA